MLFYEKWIEKNIIWWNALNAIPKTKDKFRKKVLKKIIKSKKK